MEQVYLVSVRISTGGFDSYERPIAVFDDQELATAFKDKNEAALSDDDYVADPEWRITPILFNPEMP